MARLRTRLVALLDRRRRVVAAAALGWAAIIGAGAGAAPSEQDWLGVPSLGDVLMVVIGVAAVVGVVLLVAMLVTSKRAGDTELPERKPMWPSLVILALLLVVAFRFPRTGETRQAAEVPPAAETAQEGAPSPRSSVIGEAEVGALLLIAAAAGAAIIWSRRRIALFEDGVEDEEHGDRLEPIIGRAARRLALGDDPRSSVIEAYASLEDSLEGLGLGRRLSETPTEHITRVLDRSSVAAPPVLRLAELYEVARFSEHGVTVADQRAAASALGDVHRSLTGEGIAQL